MMGILSTIYNGFYHAFANTKLSTDPAFSAWVACTFAALYYLLTILILVREIVDRFFYDGAFPMKPVGIIMALLLVLSSDWRVEHSWFGASAAEMPETAKKRAKRMALFFFVGSWFAMIGTNLALYA